jgi:hypothetical protein
LPKENKDMARKEEPTKAPTPDKLDRAMRENTKKISKDPKPYPLTEEEATPSTPKSERANASTKSSKTKKNIKETTASDYNKLVSHPRPR